MRLDQSASDAATLTLARPLATRTDNVSYHAEENLALDQLVEIDVAITATRDRSAPARGKELASKFAHLAVGV